MPLVCVRFRAASGSAVAVLVLATGCGRVGYELLDGDRPLGLTSAGGDHGSDASAGGRNGGGQLNAGAQGGAGASGGSLGAGSPDATPSSGGAAAGGAPMNVAGTTGDGGPSGGTTDSGSGGASTGGITGAGGGGTVGKPAIDCAAGITLGQLWTFATSGGWYFSAPAGTTGAITAASSPGDLDPGSIQFDVATVGSDVRSWFRFDAPQPNLAGHVGHGAIWLDSDASVTAKFFALTNDGSIWLDGGTLTLKPHAWTCMELDFNAPNYASAAYDANLVRSIGFELGSLVPFRIYIDDVGY